MILSRSPYRITLGGGGTDRPSFYQKHGGFVVSMAIDKHIYLTLKPDYLEPQIKVRYLKTEVVDSLCALIVCASYKMLLLGLAHTLTLS